MATTWILSSEHITTDGLYNLKEFPATTVLIMSNGCVLPPTLLGNQADRMKKASCDRAVAEQGQKYFVIEQNIMSKQCCISDKVFHNMTPSLLLFSWCREAEEEKKPELSILYPLLLW